MKNTNFQERSSLAKPKLVLRAGDESTEDYPYHQAFTAWAEAIEKASNSYLFKDVAHLIRVLD